MMDSAGIARAPEDVGTYKLLNECLELLGAKQADARARPQSAPAQLCVEGRGIRDPTKPPPAARSAGPATVQRLRHAAVTILSEPEYQGEYGCGTFDSLLTGMLENS